MTVFNSLGSNYDLKFLSMALFTQGQKKYSDELIQFLEKKYQGETVLFYKGREALKFALEKANLPKDSAVAINGFTCWAVYEAISSVGYKVEYLDLEDKALNFSPKILKDKLKNNPRIKIVVIQNTLGYPCQISQVAEICKKDGIILIEDLAHSIGTLYDDKREAGTVGDFVILSFSQDKIVDGISGGALVIRNKKYQKKISADFPFIDTATQYKDRLYPLFTYLIRNTYTIKLGKILHLTLKKLNLLSKPVDDSIQIRYHALSYWYCSLIKLNFDNLASNIGHRRTIASIYAKNLDKKIRSFKISQQIPTSASLRFPIFVQKRRNLVSYLQKNNIFISDIWYDAPIAPKKYLRLTTYKDQCPNSEIISQQILNLPTHESISELQAKKICQKINGWLKLQ